jgi:3-hydroxyacyl-CoA dehydrogenase/enoyl-CoA hydratase/3-hydroxybutyryl-CoA epimerase
MPRAFDYLVDAAGLAQVMFDTPEKRVNLWSADTLDELEQVLAELTARGDLAGIVFRSAKPDTFIAGADIEMLASVDSRESAIALARRGQEVFQRVADVSVPTVAAIHGACVGGGLEFALACSFRVATDDRSTRLGFPEVQLGIIPAWGGTQRAPRLIGLQQALQLILTSRLVSGSRAKRIGLVDRVVPVTKLVDAAEEVARAAFGGRRVPGGGGRGLAGYVLERNPVGRKVVFNQSRRRVRERTGGHYPAPRAAIDAVEAGQVGGLAAGFEAEAAAVGELATSSTARNLMWLYQCRETVRKPLPEGTPRTVKRLGILGAGVMGGGIAEVAAYNGIEVRLKDIAADQVAAGLAHASKIARRLERKGKFTRREVRQLMNRISGTTSYRGFQRSDVVVEAIVEDLEIKRRVLAELESVVGPETVLATNTSSLLVDDLATALDDPDRFGGLHFFNPVEKMPLVEIVRGEHTSPTAVATLHKLACDLGKTPVVVGDGPGFWVNRLLMPYLNEAAHLYAEGVSIEALDHALEKFGLPMGPLALLDEIGLDVAAKVGKVMAAAFPDRMRPHALLQRLEHSGRMGKKSGRGFYLYEGGRRKSADGDLRAELGMGSEGVGEAAVFDADYLVTRCVYPMVNEASRALTERIVASPGDGDLALVMGIGWPPFRGGLLRWADDVGLAPIVDRLDEWSAALDSRFAPAPELRERARWEGGFYGAPRMTVPSAEDSQPGLGL